MSNEKRIIGGKEDISYDNVEAFFKQRGNSNLRHKYNYVMYLDDQPEIAVERDRQAKKKIESLLSIQPDMTVLDLGCGVGRWGELFCPKGAYYVGVDGNERMIQRAEENLSRFGNKKLMVGNLRKIPNDIAEMKFDIIFFCGVLMYLNDKDTVSILQKLPELLHKNGHVCFIESMSEKERLTLKEIYSDELKQNYSAIYRTVPEFMELMTTAFRGKLTLKRNDLMDFSDGLQRKREHVTMEHCVIWEATAKNRS